MKIPLSDTGGSLTLEHLGGKHESKTKFNPSAKTGTKVPQKVQQQVATINCHRKFSKFPILAYRSIDNTEKFIS